MPAAVDVLLISGSLRAGSVNTSVLRTVAALAGDGVRATLYDGLAALPAFNPDDDPDGGLLHPVVAEVRRRLGTADAVLLCTPEYAGALPGSFKNLLDWTVGGGETYGKPTAWIDASSRPQRAGGVGAQTSLRNVLGYTGVDLVEAACRRVPVPRDAIGPDGLVADPELRDQLAAVLAALVDHVRSPPPATSSPAGDAVLEADAAFFSALLDGDLEVLEDLLAEDFLIVEVAGGAVHPRASFLEAMRDGAVAFEAIEAHPDAFRVRHYGNVAVVVGRTTMSFAGVGGASFRADSRYTHVFGIDAGRWRLLSAQGTQIPAAP